jgi:hypothetical protein
MSHSVLGCAKSIANIDPLGGQQRLQLGMDTFNYFPSSAINFHSDSAGIFLGRYDALTQ